MDIGAAFTFIFSDSDWLKKAGIAALVFLIPLVGPILLLGWGLEITRRVISYDPSPLPGWDDFSAYLTKGIQAFVVNLVYLLPGILVAILMQIVSISLSLAVDSGTSSAGNSTGGIAVLVVLCLSCFMGLLFIAAGLLIPAAVGNLAFTGELSSAFRFKDILGLFRAAPGPYLVVLLCVGLANIVLSPLGILVCGIGVLITETYTTALAGHLMGQAHNQARVARAAANL